MECNAAEIEDLSVAQPFRGALLRQHVALVLRAPPKKTTLRPDFKLNNAHVVRAAFHIGKHCSRRSGR
jgi:hypothetical protein